MRVLSDNANERFGPAFFERRVKYALDYRRAVMGADFGCCRLIFGEADGLPGLTVDRFSNLLCAQVLSRGTDGVKDIIYASLLEQLAAMGERIDGIYERNESGIRALEGLEQYKGWYAGAPHPESSLTEICENGVRYAVDLENGQKTGFFLDQKYNRLAVSRLAAGRRVLDCFTHTGSFALNCARAGAEHVHRGGRLRVRRGPCAAKRRPQRHGGQNGLPGGGRIRPAAQADRGARGLRPRHPRPAGLHQEPPHRRRRERGYHEINYRAMRLLPRGGYLATCSCSHFMPPPSLKKCCAPPRGTPTCPSSRSRPASRAPDHPILWNVPETEYLKFYIFQVV